MNLQRVLIVDDEIDLSFLLKINISKIIPSTIDIANSFKDGLKQIENAVYDLAIFDLSLGDGLGYDLIPEIKKRSNNQTKVIMISAFNTPEDTEKGLKLGASIFLSKPLSKAVLQNSLASLGYRF